MKSIYEQMNSIDDKESLSEKYNNVNLKKLSEAAEEMSGKPNEFLSLLVTNTGDIKYYVSKTFGVGDMEISEANYNQLKHKYSFNFEGKKETPEGIVHIFKILDKR